MPLHVVWVRASATASRGWAGPPWREILRWTGVEGPVDIIGPDDSFPNFPEDGIPQLLRDVFTAAGGTHDDWDEYDRVMAAERRAAILLTPERITGNA